MIEGDLAPLPKPSGAPAPSAPNAGGPAVELQSMGLHLSAEANREPHRRQVLKLFDEISERFGAAMPTCRSTRRTLPLV